MITPKKSDSDTGKHSTSNPKNSLSPPDLNAKALIPITVARPADKDLVHISPHKEPDKGTGTKPKGLVDAGPHKDLKKATGTKAPAVVLFRAGAGRPGDDPPDPKYIGKAKAPKDPVGPGGGRDPPPPGRGPPPHPHHFQEWVLLQENPGWRL